VDADLVRWTNDLSWGDAKLMSLSSDPEKRAAALAKLEKLNPPAFVVEPKK
jgi:hypothetical protein